MVLTFPPRAVLTYTTEKYIPPKFQVNISLKMGGNIRAVRYGYIYIYANGSYISAQSGLPYYWKKSHTNSK